MDAAGIILVTGAITLANEALNAPYQKGTTDVLKAINWRVIPATAVAALLFAGLDSVNHGVAVGLAAVALIAVLLTRLGKGPSPVEHLAQIMNYGGKAVSK